MIPGTTHSPEVVDEQVEDAQNDNKHYSAPLGLESDNDHDTSHGTKKNDNQSPEAPLACEDEANKEENEQDAAGKLKVHLTVLFVELGEAGWGELLAHPAVGENHQQASHDRQITQEEVEVEDEAVAEGLSDDDAEQAAYGVLAVLADDDHEGRGAHGDDVGDQEKMSEARGDCEASVKRKADGELGERTVSVVVQIGELVAPLCDDAQSIFEERHNDEEAANGGNVSGKRENISLWLDGSGRGSGLTA